MKKLLIGAMMASLFMLPDANAVRKSRVGNKRPVTKLTLAQQVNKPVVESDAEEENKEETLSEKVQDDQSKKNVKSKKKSQKKKDTKNVKSEKKSQKKRTQKRKSKR